MGKKSLFTVIPPLGGLHKRSAYQSQPPYTTPDCLNVRPIDVTDERKRVGKRPGLTKFSATRLGSTDGYLIRSLGNVSYTATSGSSQLHYTIGCAYTSDGAFYAQGIDNAWNSISAKTYASLNKTQYT